MPRLQPGPGQITATQVKIMLNCTDGIIAHYIKKGLLHRVGPVGRSHKFYKLAEVEAIIASRYLEPETYTSGQWRDNPISTFARATPDDMAAIMDISARAFPHPDGTPNTSLTPIETRLAWLARNPETFFVVRDAERKIVAYASLFPGKRATIDQILTGERSVGSLAPDDFELFTPGNVLDLYIMALVVDPAYSAKERHRYGMRLITGLYALLLDIGSRGVEVETIAARSRRGDGLRLLRHVGIPELRSINPDYHIFALQLAGSGYWIFARYNDRLNQWRETQRALHLIRRSPTTRQGQDSRGDTPPATRRPTSAPDGMITLDALCGDLGVSTSTMKEHLIKGHYEDTPIFKRMRGEVQEFSHFFTPEQASRARAWHAENARKKPTDH